MTRERGDVWLEHRKAWIAEFCARSPVLAPEDIDWFETGGTFTGRRDHAGVRLTHRPSGLRATADSEKVGGRTRREDRDTREALYAIVLRKLEDEVRRWRNDQRRASSTRRHA
jgi:hypothetical protein